FSARISVTTSPGWRRGSARLSGVWSPPRRATGSSRASRPSRPKPGEPPGLTRTGELPPIQATDKTLQPIGFVLPNREAIGIFALGRNAVPDGPRRPLARASPDHLDPAYNRVFMRASTLFVCACRDSPSPRHGFPLTQRPRQAEMRAWGCLLDVRPGGCTGGRRRPGSTGAEREPRREERHAHRERRRRLLGLDAA